MSKNEKGLWVKGEHYYYEKMIYILFPTLSPSPSPLRIFKGIQNLVSYDNTPT